MKTQMNKQGNQRLARAWALLDRAEQLARQTARDEAGPSLWLLAANSILRARDALEAIDPAAPNTGEVDAAFDGNCRDLVRAAVRELAAIPQESVGLSVALVHLAAAEHEVGGRFVP
jgi:hypothetical protein